jgi:hypothetical protein
LAGNVEERVCDRSVRRDRSTLYTFACQECPHLNVGPTAHPDAHTPMLCHALSSRSQSAILTPNTGPRLAPHTLTGPHQASSIQYPRQEDDWENRACAMRATMDILQPRQPRATRSIHALLLLASFEQALYKHRQQKKHIAYASREARRAPLLFQITAKNNTPPRPPHDSDLVPGTLSICGYRCPIWSTGVFELGPDK